MAIVPGNGRGILRYAGDKMLYEMPGHSITTAAPQLDPETITWRNRALAAGGGFLTNSISIADGLIKSIKRTSFDSKLVYLLPLLGSNLATALVPLRDKLGVGAAVNTNFVDSDYSQLTGLQGDGATKILDSRVFPDRLGTATSGGLGWIENNIGTATRGPMGYAHNPGGGTRAYSIFLGATYYGMDWGKSLEALVPNAPGNGHYYGQSPTNSYREMFLNGSKVAENSAVDTVDDAAYTGLRLMGAEVSNVVAGPYYWGGRCACTYMTDGTLSVSEITKLGQILRDRLFTPTSRPAS